LTWDTRPKNPDGSLLGPKLSLGAPGSATAGSSVSIDLDPSVFAASGPVTLVLVSASADSVTYCSREQNPSNSNCATTSTAPTLALTTG
jgi:hypothetical protein